MNSGGGGGHHLLLKASLKMVRRNILRLED